MKKLPKLDEWLILEKNATVEYFRQHPELLQPKFRDITQHKSGYKPNLPYAKSSKPVIVDAYNKMIKLNDGSELILHLKGRDYENLEFFKWVSGYDQYYRRSVDFVNILINSNSIADFYKKMDSNRIEIDYATSTKDIPELDQFLKNNFREFRLICKDLNNAVEGLRIQPKAAYDKQFLKLGLSKGDIEKAMSWINDWTSMSRKRLPSDVWPLIRSISVDESKLPEYIYRGIFIDGAKIKDINKFLERWKAGSKPMVSQGKATSWSYSRGTASSFMTDQDFIKDKKGGFYCLLKWKVNPKFVIADLRNLPVDNKFWNQQEFIVDPAAKDYEVDTLISGEDEAGYQEFLSSIKGGQGAWGMSKNEFIGSFFKMPFEELDINSRIEFKRTTLMTMDEVEAEYGKILNWSEEYRSKVGNVSFPLAMFIQSQYFAGFHMSFNKIISKNEIELEFLIDLDNMWSNKTPNLKAIFDKVKKKNDFNHFYCSYVLIGKGIIRLENPTFYSLNFIIEFPKTLDISDCFREDNIELRKKGNPQTILADDSFREIVNEFGIDNFLNVIQIGIAEIKLPRNMHITTK